MPSQLVCRPQQDLPVAVLRVAGVLDDVTGAALHSAVLESLAAQPEAVLLDVRELRIDDPGALAVLAVAADETAEWPGVPIVLCGADPDTARQVQQSPAGHAVSLADDCVAALARIGSGAPRRLRLRLRPVPDACRKARQLVTQACTAWHLGELVSAGALIATELVANVVRHAHTGMELTVLLRDGRVLLAVRDGSTRLPEPADPGLNDAGGRGLRLVRELADSWGVLPLSSGKVVWTTLSAPGTSTVAA
jgi:anti-anti-sigma regulatory factor/anti-sigma regulatory factor (Ser/Thr protein kinase)